MRRNICNLELTLFPPYGSSHQHHNHPMIEEADGSKHQQHQQLELHHQLTIFYDGKICVTDVTELQAKSILMLANKKVEEKVRTPTGSESSSPTINVQSHHPLYSPGTGLSMKRSLQRFLQKRKNRIQEASPYNHQPNQLNVKIKEEANESNFCYIYLESVIPLFFFFLV